MIITATFTGQNSLGYENGKEYDLKISTYHCMSICKVDNTCLCIYESLRAFLRNWNNIKVVKK